MTSTHTAPVSLQPGWRRASSPKSIAIVGASDDNYYVRSVVDNLNRASFDGKIMGVHPRRTTACGLPCVPSLAQAGPIDLTFIAVGREQVFTSVQEAVELGTGGIVVIADGFTDSHNPDWVLAENSLAALTRAAGVPLIGPNTLGFITPRSKAVIFSVPVTHEVEDGDIALLVQSGGLLSGALGYLYALRTGVAQAVAIGNARCVTAADWVRLVLADNSVKVVGLLLESVGNWADLRAALEEAAAKDVVVVACITGKSEEGMAVAQSHTGALATEYRVLATLLRRYSALLVDNVNELVVTLAIISRFGRPKARGAGVFGQSGGGNGQLADMCQQAGVPLPSPQSETITAVRQGRFAVSGNPIDVASIAMTDSLTFEAAAEAFFSDPAFGAAVYNVTLDPDPFRRSFLRAVQNGAHASSCPVIATPVTFTPADAPLLREFSEHPWVLTVPVPEHAIGALGKWIQLAVPGLGQPATDPQTSWVPSPEQWRNEADTKTLLRRRGVAVPLGRWLPSGAPEGTSTTLKSARVAVKGVSRVVGHKAKWGLVQLVPNVPTSVDSAIREIRHAADRAGIPLDGILVEEVVDAGPELIMSVTREALGDLVMLGPGGGNVESGPTPAFAVLPINDLDLDHLLDAAGLPQESREAISRMIDIAVGFFIDKRLEQLELNPVRLDAEGVAWVLDTLAYQGSTAADVNRQGIA